ncbi:MAG: YbhN family protein [Haloarculaceae archaeon]
MDSRNVAATVLGFGVAAAVLGALAYVVGTEDVLAALARARPGPVVVVAGCIVGWVALWGLSLQSVLSAVGTDVSTVDAVLVNASTAFANHVTPFGQAGGEPVAAWLLSDVADAEFERSLAAVASFDALNVVPSLSLAGVGLAYYASVAVLGERLRAVATGLAGLAVALPLAALLLWRGRGGIERWLVGAVAAPLAIVGRVLPRVDPPDHETVAARVGTFVESIERVAGDRRRLAVALGYSATGWLAQVAGLWVAFHALDAVVPPYVALFVVPLGTVASALPTPGGLGGIETVQIALLTAAIGVPAATIAAAVAIFSVGGFFLTTSIGAAAFAVLQARERRVLLPE